MKTLQLLFLFAVLSSTASAQSYKWKVSNLNGYTYYSDRVYPQNFILKGSSAKDIGRSFLLFGGLLPQPAITRRFDKFECSLELRGHLVSEQLPVPRHAMFPYPAMREEMATSLLIGKTFNFLGFNHRIMAGYSHRWRLNSGYAQSREQDSFSIDKTSANEPGVIIKYEIIRPIGDSKRFEVGVGVNRSFYKSRIHVWNAGLVVGANFGKVKS